MKEFDQKWLEKLDILLEQNMSDSDFYLPEIAMALATSTAQLNRKINELTDLSPRMYIRQKKLMEAKRILEVGRYSTVKEVSIAVGYKHVTHFSTIFYEAFGKRPFEYLKK